MARREQTVAITAEGRDQGKVFVLREMPASQAEKWAARALLALAKSGVEIPDDAAQAGLAGVASIGFQAFGGLSWELAEPLLDEMFDCVKIQPGDNAAVTRKLIEDDIEEVATRLKLRMALFELHTGFSMGAKKLISGSAARQNPV
jgi:hypothetical protein